MRLGLYGSGRQGQRYLDPTNWPEGIQVEYLGRDDFLKADQDGIIIATPPSTHAERLRRIASSCPALCEKPVSLSSEDADEIARRHGPLLIAHTHLWHWDFLRLDRSSSATVQWRGPTRGDGSCSALMDWGPHAWAMAIALGTERVSTGPGDRRENVVRSGSEQYRGDSQWPCNPMKEMLATFASLIDNGYDWRAEPDFTLEVHRRCLKASDPKPRSEP